MRGIALTFFQPFSLPQSKGFDWIEILLDRVELLVILDNRVKKEKKKSIQHLLGVPQYRDSEAKCKINGFPSKNECCNILKLTLETFMD